MDQTLVQQNTSSTILVPILVPKEPYYFVVASASVIPCHSHLIGRSKYTS